MSLPSNLIRDYEGLNQWCILHAYRGSIAHGMYEPSTEPNSIDDKDTMALCVPPVSYYLGLGEFGSRGTQEIVRDEWDIVVYEARKAIRLLAQGNPNVLSLLWLPPTMYIKKTVPGRLLIDNRDHFVGKHVYKPFVGYAKAQLHKMEHGAHQGYMGEKRKALVAKHGYDTKNASHLIRLLRMGIEFMSSGELQVDRGGLDATELLDIKHGEWSLSRVQEEATRLFELAYDAYVRSPLPPGPDREAIGELCVAVIESALKGER